MPHVISADHPGFCLVSSTIRDTGIDNTHKGLSAKNADCVESTGTAVGFFFFFLMRLSHFIVPASPQPVQWVYVFRAN